MRHTQAVPLPVIASFERMTGVDLGFVPMVRGPYADDAARQRNAQAFTEDGTVYLPTSAGPADRSDTHALLGHELAHVLQQRALPELPGEQSTAGRRLEEQARTIEQTLRGEPIGPVEPPTRDDGDRGTARMSWSPSAGFHSGSASGVRADAPVQRAPNAAPAPAAPTPPNLDLVPAAGDARFDNQPPAGDGAGPTVDWERFLRGWSPETADGSHPLVYPGDSTRLLAWLSGDEGGGDNAPVPGLAGLPQEQLNWIVNQVRAAMASAFDPEDSELLDRLTPGLYERIGARLRRELIVDRERAGVLTEFH